MKGFQMRDEFKVEGYVGRSVQVPKLAGKWLEER